MLKTEQLGKEIPDRQSEIPKALDYSTESIRERENAQQQYAERNSYTDNMTVIKPFFIRRCRHDCNHYKP